MTRQHRRHRAAPIGVGSEVTERPLRSLGLAEIYCAVITRAAARPDRAHPLSRLEPAVRRQTQPAVLALAVERSENDLPNVGYATVFPIAMIAKIVLAQLVLRWGG